MEIKKVHIQEMAQLILCKQLCFLNINTGNFEHHPEEIDLFLDEKNPWQEVIDKIEANTNQYIRIEPMNANQSFTVMESFVNQLAHTKFRKKLLAALYQPKPFRNFNNLIHQSHLRQSWFYFQQEKSIAWVKQQISYQVDE